MKSKWLKPLIALSILAVIITVTMIVSNKMKNSALEDQGEIIKLIDRDQSTLKTITITNIYDQTIILQNNDQNNWTMTNNPDYYLDENLINEVTTNFASLQAYRIIEENPQDIEIYGLTEPQCTVSAVLTDNTTIELNIGNKTNEYYYATMAGNPTVYLIYGTAAETMTNMGFNLRSTIVSEIDIDHINYVSINENGNELEITKETAENEETTNSFLITKPYPQARQANLNTLIQNIFQPISDFRIKKFVDDSETELDYSQYGLDNPKIEIQLSDDTGLYVNLQFGNDTEDDNIYFRDALRPNVYSMDKKLLEPLLNISLDSLTE